VSKKGDADKSRAPMTGPFNNPFGKLEALKGAAPAGPAPSATEGAVSKPSKPKGPARAVVRMERKGRGGKEVTVVERLELPPKELELWLKALKQAMGCGGVLEDGAIVLQGDQRERLPPVLEARGVRKVILG
jgi:translation initiation factor 1